MNDYQNLLDTVNILEKQEEMLQILEKQQSEIDMLIAENLSQKEQIDELTALNNTLTDQLWLYEPVTKKSTEQTKKQTGI